MLDKNGMIVIETKRDANTVNITAIGSDLMKPPEPSGKLAKGKNASNRVAVHPIMATKI